MEQHIHHFVRWAGGTDLTTGISDDCYDCSCGATLGLESTPEQHVRTPAQIDIALEEA